MTHDRLLNPAMVACAMSVRGTGTASGRRKLKSHRIAVVRSNTDGGSPAADPAVS
jgi:hypothetical protein